jgi:flagellar basal-body rod modification protein FlgD
MTVDFSTLNTTTTSAASTTSSAGSSATDTSAADASDRFLKLLVTQMQNQDPLNPMDNAQVTSQMAQINTVSGIDKLNTTVSGLNGQFLQMQALQGASLVGRNVWVEGTKLSMQSDGSSEAAFNLSGAADHVKVEVLSPSGQVVDTMDLGAETEGRHSFSWSKAGVTDTSGLSFRVSAASGAASVPVTPLMLDKVDSVGIDGDTLKLALEKSGDVAYSKVLAFD